MASAPNVPIFVDNTRPSGNARYVRCTYFCIDCQTPQTDWSLALNYDSIPIVLLGMSCIIISPLEGGFFTAPQQIERLFDLIEQKDGLVIEVNDLLVPAWLLRDQETLRRGDTLRAGIDFFRSAFAFRAGRLSEEEYFLQAERAEQPLFFSAEETQAFRAWEENVINEVKRDYPKDRELALRWTDRNDDPGAPGANRPPPPDIPPYSGLGNFPFKPIPTPRQSTRQNEGLTLGDYA
jgi:hypothetical protein